MKTESPFETSLKKYLAIFNDQEMYFVNDIRNVELFQKIPNNTNSEDIRNKLSALNDHDINRLSIQNEMIEHILQLTVDQKIKGGDLSVVDQIAQITIRGENHNLLHFASVYCNLHQPALFPIYSDQHFVFYRAYIKSFNVSIQIDRLNEYTVFCEALNDFINRLGIKGKYNYLQIRKFGWLYFEKVVAESTVSS